MPRTKRTLSGQRHIDWNRQAQLAAINGLDLPDRLAGLGDPVSRCTAMHVLRVIDDCQREQETAWPSLKTIAARSRRSVKTVRRAIAALESVGLLTAWEERTDRGYRRLMFAIEWSRIFGERLPPAMPERVPLRRREKPVDSANGPVDISQKPVDSLAKSSGQSVPPTTYEPKRRTVSPFPPSVNASWAEAERALSDLGVDWFDIAVKTARQHVSAEHVLQLCEHFRRHATAAGWVPAQLYLRVCKARPYIPVEEKWPQRRATPVASPKAASPDQFLELDRLSDHEIADLIRRFGSPTLRQLLEMGNARTLRESDQWRPELLRILEREGVPA